MSDNGQSRKEYIARINRVMDYVDRYIDQVIHLDDLAQVANFSPYHFHRIFSTLTGEPPGAFVQRVRIERAAQQLYNDDLSISEIAYSCGFSSVSLFSRTFRKHFGMSAKEFRQGERPIYAKDGLRYSKNGKLLSKKSKALVDFESHLCSVKLKQLVFMNTTIEVKDMPAINVVYCRHTGAFDQIGAAYEKLMTWAGPHGLLQFPETQTITVYHDDPAVTAIENIRQSACITVKGDVKVDGEIGKMTVEGGKYAVGRFDIDVTEFEKSWNTMCAWLIDSGYQPADGNPYELYYGGDSGECCNKRFILDICIPVKSL